MERNMEKTISDLSIENFLHDIHSLDSLDMEILLKLNTVESMSLGKLIDEDHLEKAIEAYTRVLKLKNSGLVSIQQDRWDSRIQHVKINQAAKSFMPN
jgi:predicted transcriptional regulator